MFGLLSVNRASATLQEPDRLIIDGETFYLINYYPLYNYPVEFTTQMLFGGTDECFSTGCWRGYIVLSI